MQGLIRAGLGWEDLNDHKALRQDVAMQTAVGVDREVASAPTLCRLESWANAATAARLHEVLVEQFIASFDAAPDELVLDFDARLRSQPVARAPGALAYGLIERMRALALQGAELATAQIDTLRIRLLKLAAVVTRNTRRIRLYFASN